MHWLVCENQFSSFFFPAETRQNFEASSYLLCCAFFISLCRGPSASRSAMHMQGLHERDPVFECKVEEQVLRRNARAASAAPKLGRNSGFAFFRQAPTVQQYTAILVSCRETLAFACCLRSRYYSLHRRVRRKVADGVPHTVDTSKVD